MSEQGEETNASTSSPRDLDFEQARLAYSIIESLLDHTRVISDLIALMAQVLDEDTIKAITNTPHWQAYLDSRRALERTRDDVEKFAEVMKRLSGEEID
ncbi:MAG TPA: hypothetical protein VKB86_02215 [Pyrinomonadaceae bacterium]|nr:hypothetical protein [Pyrinomonadaceae bacterium]